MPVKKALVHSKSHGMRMTCAKCHENKKIDDFFLNKENVRGYNHDFWCKECVKKYVKTLDLLKEYCYFNNRIFSELLYARCENDALKILEEDKKYESMLQAEDKTEYAFEFIAKKYFSMMGMNAYYVFIDNQLSEEKLKETIEQIQYDKALRDAQDDSDKEETKYDPVWFGDYTKKELKFLNFYYEKLESQFEITDIHIENNFRAVAKAELELNQAFDLMRQGKPGADERYKKAVDVYAKLSDMAKLSAKTRSADGTVGFGSLGLLVKYMEVKGFLQKKIEFEPDDVDRINSYTRNMLVSFEGEKLNRDGGMSE